jgi:hypothetical protein
VGERWRYTFGCLTVSQNVIQGGAMGVRALGCETVIATGNHIADVVWHERAASFGIMFFARDCGHVRVDGGHYDSRRPRRGPRADLLPRAGLWVESAETARIDGPTVLMTPRAPTLTLRGAAASSGTPRLRAATVSRMMTAENPRLDLQVDRSAIRWNEGNLQVGDEEGPTELGQP